MKSSRNNLHISLFRIASRLTDFYACYSYYWTPFYCEKHKYSVCDILTSQCISQFKFIFTSIEYAEIIEDGMPTVKSYRLKREDGNYSYIEIYTDSSGENQVTLYLNKY